MGLCHTRGCTNRGEECEYPGGEVAVFCTKHMPDEGFCLGCGCFVLGTGDEVHLKSTGLCLDCYSSEIMEDERYEDEGDGWMNEYRHNWYDKDIDSSMEDSTHTYIGPRE